MAAPMTFFRRRCFFIFSLYRQPLRQYAKETSNGGKVPKSSILHINENKRLYLEFGQMAKFADGSVVAKYGDTAVLVAVTSRTESMPNAQFLPLTVDYRQKSAAAGRIPTNHLRRELGPTDKEILTSRVIDRSLRTLFPGDYFNETQITCNLLSVDGVNDPDVVSINAASAALTFSDVPWNGPVGAVRVGHVKDTDSFVINPTRKEQQHSDLNLVIATDVDENVVMLEGDANNISYDLFKKAISFGAKSATDLARQLNRLKYTKPKKRLYSQPAGLPDGMAEEAAKHGSKMIKAVLNNSSHDKISRDKALQKARYSIIEKLSDTYTESQQVQQLHEALNGLVKQTLRDQIISDKKRCDGRQLKDLRQISAKVDLFSPLHGSALFQRGQTQVLSTVTFDSLQAAMKLDPVSVLTGAMKEKNFMLHYEFPAYATNEVKAPGIKNRRELGHGALAEKGLRAIIPDNFPFSIRLTCEVLESNGSSSMASICAGSLALMDAGVQIKEPAAGVAIGLVTSDAVDLAPNGNKYYLLADILGIEDYFGEMDMKVGGTKNGVTAIQMDLKIPGIPVSTVHEALYLAKAKISHIISIMKNSAKIDVPRESIKSNGPVLEKITVPPSKRGSFVGTGGMNLKKLRSDAGVTVTPLDESTYEIFAPNKDAMDEAKEMMDTWLEAKKEPELEFNAVYEAKITELKDFGVMVQLHPAMEPVLLHNSQLDHRQVSHPSALGFEVGQIISVKYFGRDPATGKMRLSRKVITAPSSRTFKFMKDES
ncbi:polyribonucleotide nucleotidyltransferase 1, mitochondrial-like [Mercenaria mercenaria]|uniref:polyribonucleotide nucleotidyltransferase 1, mitochondrial-like n=1 Tax=Mercenaria mercenaria TaxID=6596 RepID=UPI00234E6AC2|nr:polyribonucleotide nucleotidyltransferase 1, mitochondrial-like [Mercenaria mercenaria]